MKHLRSLVWLALPLALALSCSDVDGPFGYSDTTPPARVTDLDAVDASAAGITLAWTAPGDDGNSGTADAYQVRASNDTITEANWSAAVQVPGAPSPAAHGSAESFTFTGFDTTRVHHFALRARDESDNWSKVSNDAVWTPRGPVVISKDIPANLDNTLYAESDTLSNALGQHFYSGLNNASASGGTNSPRRGSIAFAIADSIPAGVVIDSVALVLNLSKRAFVIPGNSPTSLHVLTASWGEGTSIANLFPGEGGGGVATPGDATWLDRFRGTSLWTSPGGDFNAVASATVQTNALGKYTWTTTTMRGDVQNWLDNPSTNFGWLVIGDEAAGGGNARQWDSRQNNNAVNRPRLTVFYHITP